VSKACLSMAGQGRGRMMCAEDKAGISRHGAGAEQLRSDLAPEVARQHTRDWSHDDEQPEGGAAGHHLLKEMENALGQVLR